MNMITFSARSRGEIIRLHNSLTDAIEVRDSAHAELILHELEQYTLGLGHDVMAARTKAS
ncbi:MAG: FadR family transcriptional regulator, partial [Pseudomonadota bacterium]